MKKLLPFLLSFICVLALNSQLLINENFDYATGTELKTNGWVGTGASPSTINPILITTSSISYAGYSNSGVGNEIAINTTGEDLNKSFTAQTSGTLYVSAIINITSAQTTGDYFIHIADLPTGTSYFGRVYVKLDGTKLAFGILNANGGTLTPTYTSSAYDLNTTYLLVMKYNITTNIASLIVNPSTSTTEPSSNWISSTSGTTLPPTAGFSTINIRQGTASNAATLKLDGIRVALSWSDLLLSINNNITTSTSLLSGFDYIHGNGPSTQKSFNVSGSGLTNGITITAPTNYEISALSGSSFNGTNSITIGHTNGIISPITIYVRLKSGLTANNYNGNLTLSSSGSTTRTISLSGLVIPSIITVSTNSITDFIYTFGAGPSNQKSFILSGSGLTSGITVTAPSNYEISALSGTSFNGTNVISIPQSNGNVSSITLYTRLKSGLNINTYTGNISLTSTYAESQTITLSGSVTYPQGVTLSTVSVSGFEYKEGFGPSAEKSFLVSGVGLSSFVILTAPSNYEISTTSGSSFSGSGQIILQHVGGSINGITIYIRLNQNLVSGNYIGNLSASTTGYPTKYISLSGNVNEVIANYGDDPAIYEPIGKMTLKNKWLKSNNLSTYNNTADFIAPAMTARGMAVKDGKMLFIDRTNKQIVVVNGATGVKETPIALASNLFTYLGRNKANTADSTWTAGIFGFNDLKVDDEGNVLLGNLIAKNTARFQIWKVNMSNGTGTLVIDQADLSILFPFATSMRFDYFNVWGDVNGSAVIIAANGSTTAMEVYKWVITDGVAATPILIELDNTTIGTYLTGLGNLGSGPQVFPVDDNLFYVDGNATYPTLIDKDGNIVDGFYNNPSALIDSVTAPTTTPKTIWPMNQGHNGVIEFEVGGKYFLLMAASNTVGVPPSTFRLFKFADSSKAFSGLDCLWTFPQAGMGSTSNPYRVGMPDVEVNGSVAKIYVYTGENGYGMYEFETNQTWTETTKKQSSELKIYISNNEIRISEEVAKAEVYSITGQKVISEINVTTLKSPLSKGIYLVSVVDKNGFKKTEKIIVR